MPTPRPMKQAFRALDLLVVVDVAFTETASLAHYVLPAKSAYEKWDGTFFAWNFPEIFFPDEASCS